MDGDQEPDRLRALLTLMREFGMTRLVTPDGFTLERPPLSPLEASVGVGQTSPTSAKASRDETEDDDESTDAEDRAEKNLERRWNEHWSRVGLSSGAGIPAFPGGEKAARFLARYP